MLEAIVLPLSIVYGWLGVPPMLRLVGASRQEPLHEDAVLVQVLDGESMVRTWSFEQLLEVVRGALSGLLTPPCGQRWP